MELIINAQNKTQNSKEEAEDDKSEEIFGQTNENLKHKSKVNLNISEDDILSNTMLFFFAGSETIASLLTHLFYSLAVDQKCQQKLYEEVKRFDGNYDYESISQMPYLEACVAETLRIYNPLANTSRMAAEDYKLGWILNYISKYNLYF